MYFISDAGKQLIVSGPDLQTVSVALTWDELFTADEPLECVRNAVAAGRPAPVPAQSRAPLSGQEVWAAGVTYLRSRTARIEESKSAGGDAFYEKVYTAERPELFFKATPHRVAGPGQAVRLRDDSLWNVPEPELALAITQHGKIFGYTIANDLSSRDIEGENPLYLPQAKVFDLCAALGPCLWVTATPPVPTTVISLQIVRDGAVVVQDSVAISQMKRSFESLVGFLFRNNSFPLGCYLMTGTGIVPADNFTLKSGDEVRISIPPIGTLVNPVA